MIEFDFSKTLKGINQDFNLEVKGQIHSGEKISFFGPSGAGKSTILRIFAGLIRPDFGKIIVDGEIWNDPKKFLPPQKRNIGFVFQDYALFPHLNVRENIGFGKNVSKTYVDELLEIMELHSIAKHRMSQLSGGEAQRVAIARALAQKPKLILLDEPLSALDFRIKDKIIKEIQSLQSHFGFSMILVSHHLAEIYRLSDRIFELKQGEIVCIKSPKQDFAEEKIALNAEVVGLTINANQAHIEVLLYQEIYKLSCNLEQLNGIKLGDQIQIFLKPFSFNILHAL